MRFRFIPVLLLIGLFVLAGGCSRTRISMMEDDLGVELSATPFFAQEEYQCGPASLAMLLGASGVDVLPKDVMPLTYLPDRKGSLQLELKAAVRRFGRIPFQIGPNLDGLVGELKAGRPVMILQKQGFAFWPAYHYAVVIGFLPGDRLILRSGTRKRMEISARRFLLLWNRAGSWGMVALKPGEIPAAAAAQTYIEAVSAFEETGQADAAAASYASAVKRWPADQTVLFGAATNLLIRGDVAQAQKMYRQLLELYPDHLATANNYAEALLQTGQVELAEQTIRSAIHRSKPSDSTMKKILLETLQKIESIKTRNFPREEDGPLPDPN